jgi:hypothetical protein
MKKIATSLFVGALCTLSMNVSAFDGLNLTSLPDNNHSFTLKHHDTDTGDGIKGKIMITAGIGLNFEGSSLVVRYAISPYYNSTDFISGHQTRPMINAAVDYGFAKKFSAGVAFGYQTIIMNMNNVIVTGDSYHDTWTRLHFAARADYYIVAKDNINLYTGVKLGYNIFTVTTTLPPAAYPDYIQNLGVYPNPVSVQAHIGFSYFVKGIVGVNAEFGLGYGGPYMFAVGATVKI